MAFTLIFACRRHSLRQFRHLFSTSVADAADAKTSSLLSTVTQSLLCRENDPTRSVSTLFSFPDRSCARYDADHALRNLSRSLNHADRSFLLDSFIPLASDEQDFASLLISYGSAFLADKALIAFRQRLAAGGSLSVSTLSFNALLSAFMRSRQHRRVPELFVRICDKHSISPDVVSYGLLIHALFRSNRSSDAFATLKQIRDERGIVLTDQIYNLLLISLRSQAKPEEANQFWNEMVANGVKLDCTAYNVKVWYHALRGETQIINQLISEMESAGDKILRPDTLTYNYLIGCLSKNDRFDDVKEFYKRMSEKNSGSLGTTTFTAVLNCLCRNGDFEMGIEVFRDSLRSNKVLPVRLLEKLVDGLVKEGKVMAAKEVIKGVRGKVQGRSDYWKEVEMERELDSDCQAAGSFQGQKR